MFRSSEVGWSCLPPPSLRDSVQEALNLSAFLDTYTEEYGYPPYHPGMMMALLPYGRGLYSSRQLARSCDEWVDVMASTSLRRIDRMGLVSAVVKQAQLAGCEDGDRLRPEVRSRRGRRD